MGRMLGTAAPRVGRSMPSAVSVGSTVTCTRGAAGATRGPGGHRTEQDTVTLRCCLTALGSGRHYADRQRAAFRGVGKLTALLILVGLWVIAGVIGYFTGRAGSSPGCLIYGLMFIVFGILGFLTFMLGAVIGRKSRDRERLQQRMEGASVPTWRDAGPVGALPPSSGSSTAIGVGNSWQGAELSGSGPVAAGWVADPSNPLVQWYWTGTTWSRRVRWTGSAWEPF